MVRRAIGCLGFLAGLFVLAGGGSVTAAPTPVPDMKPDLSSMSFFVGTWKCEGTVRGKTRPDTLTFSMALDGRWLMSHDEAPPFDQFRTRPVITDSWMTYNPLNKLWVSTSVDNFGGYGMATSPGWKGSQMTTTVTVSNDGTMGHDTLTKVSDTQTKDVAVGIDKGGKAQPPVTTTCTKQ
jgi:hypothetical protein